MTAHRICEDLDYKTPITSFLDPFTPSSSRLHHLALTSLCRSSISDDVKEVETVSFEQPFVHEVTQDPLTQCYPF
jgi:hypothetical protein